MLYVGRIFTNVVFKTQTFFFYRILMTLRREYNVSKYLPNKIENYNISSLHRESTKYLLLSRGKSPI